MPRFKHPGSALSRLSDRIEKNDEDLFVVGYNSVVASSVAMPTGLAAAQEGDLIILFAASTSSTAPNLPTGFTNISLVGSNPRLRAAYKISDGTETTITSAGSAYTSVIIWRNHGGIGKTVNSEPVSTVNPQNIGVISPLSKNSRVVTGTAVDALLGGGMNNANNTAVISGGLGITLNPSQEGGTFGGTCYRTQNAPAKFCSIEVLAA